MLPLLDESEPRVPIDGVRRVLDTENRYDLLVHTLNPNAGESPPSGLPQGLLLRLPRWQYSTVGARGRGVVPEHVGHDAGFGRVAGDVDAEQVSHEGAVAHDRPAPLGATPG